MPSLDEHRPVPHHDDQKVNKENLRLVQMIELKILLEFDRVCREHGIRYFLGGGTLLGAARYGGFIPWDDDVDVMMDRENYRKLESIAPTAFVGDYFFQTNETDPFYHFPYAKLRLEGTAYTTRFASRFPEMHNGFFIDIFVHDEAPTNPLAVKAHIYRTLFDRSMVFHKWQETPMQFYGKFKVACALATRSLEATSMGDLERRQSRTIMRYDGRKTGALYDGMGEHLRHGVFPAELLGADTELFFEGHRLPAPLRYYEYLAFSYGDDFMTPPSEDRRGMLHDIVALDFGTFEEEAKRMEFETRNTRRNLSQCCEKNEDGKHGA